MKKTWDVSRVEIIPMRVPVELYDQLLEELAELVYRHLCQLPEIETSAPETASTPCLERTGTDD